MWRRTPDATHRDRAIVVPDVEAAALTGQAAIDHRGRIPRLALAEGFLLEGDQPGYEVVAIGWPGVAQRARHALRSRHRRELVRVFAHEQARGLTGPLGPGRDEGGATSGGPLTPTSGCPARSATTSGTTARSSQAERTTCQGGVQTTVSTTLPATGADGEVGRLAARRGMRLEVAADAQRQAVLRLPRDEERPGEGEKRIDVGRASKLD